MNLKVEGSVITLDGENLEIVSEHKYLGTLVDKKGRVNDRQTRVKDCTGVLNEILELCKSDGCR